MVAASTNHPQITRFHYAWSTLLIIGWVTLAGLSIVWLFSPVKRETTLAVVLTAGSLLLAILQYVGTFRYHREAAVVATWLNGILGGITFLLTSSVILGAFAVVSQANMLRPLLTIVAQAMLVTVFITNANLLLAWSEQLYQAQQSNALPQLPRFFSLREIFLLILVISFLLGIVSFGMRHGWQYVKLL